MLLECPDANDGVLDCRHLLTAVSIKVAFGPEIASSERGTLNCSGLLADGSVSRLKLREMDPPNDLLQSGDLRFEIPLHYLNDLSDKSKLHMALLVDGVHITGSAVFSVLTLSKSSEVVSPVSVHPLYFYNHTPTSFSLLINYHDPLIKFRVVYGRDDDWPNLKGERETNSKIITIEELQPGTRYFVIVFVVTSNGEKELPEGVTSTLRASELPDAPTDLTARPSSYAVALTWNASALATSYRVRYGYPNGPIIDTLTFTTTTATIGGLNSSTAYRFDLRAENAAGESSPVFTTATTLQVPAAPLDLRASPAILTMDLTWSASAGANRYNVRYGLEPGGTPEGVTVNSTSHQLTGLSKNTLYFVAVTAVNANGESLATRITQKTLDGPQIPSRPWPLHKIVTLDTAEIFWPGSTTRNFEVAYGLEDKHPEVIDRQTTQSLRHTIKYLAPDTRYFVEVRAFNESGYSEPGPIGVVTGPDLTQPRGLRNPGRTFSEAWLKWESPEDVSYLIDYEITCPRREPVRTTALQHILTDLIPAKEYTFKIQPRRIEGPVPALPVFIQVITHDRVPPTKPGNLKLTASTQGNATLSWRASADNVGVTGYQMRRNGGAWVAVSGTSHSVTGLIEGVVERFEVRAMDAAGNWSIPAGVSNKKEPPSAPQNFRYSQLGLMSILEWDAPIDTTDISNYEIVLTGPQGGTRGYSTVYRALTTLLLPRTRYDVRITARNADGESPPLIAEMTTN